MLRVTCLTGMLVALLAAGCSRDNGNTFYQGYVEGEYLYLAAPMGGYLASLDVARGSRVEAGKLAFSIAPDPELQGLQEAEARAVSARERVENLKEPRRQSEIAALEAQLRAAETALQLSDIQLRQQESLAQKGYISQSRLDEAKAARARDLAQVDAARQQLATYKSTLGRRAEVRSAEADFQAAGAQVAQKRWQVDKKSVTAPAVGEIVETFYRPGEWVPAGQPVASLLPDDRRLIRFFVPETALANIRVGQEITAGCDGCKAPIRAKVTFVAPQAEYTPPVIYSRGMREKLVFRVEAVPAPDQAPALRPGLPLDVRLVGG